MPIEFGEMILNEMTLAPSFAKWSVELSLSSLSGRTIELGCGVGNNLSFLQASLKDVWGCDYNSKYIEVVQSRNILPKEHLFVWDITQPFPLNINIESFFCPNVIEYIEDDLNALKHIRSIPGLKRGVVIVPASPFLTSRIDRNLMHFRRYSRSQLRSLCDKAGFKTLKIKSYNKIGAVGWFFQGKILRKDTLGTNNMRLFNLLMPIFKKIDPFLPWIGLSYIAYVDIE